MNAVVGFNMRFFRRAAKLTQEELGNQIGGWSKVVVSTAERSWDGQRVRQFNADEIVAIAKALGVPAVALLLPPPDSGTGVDYTFTAGPYRFDADGLAQLAITDYQGDSPAMVAFRERLMHLGGSWFMDAVRSEAERILVLARDQAQQLIGEGGDAAREIERDAQERQQAIRPLVQQVEELQRRIDDLRAFERDYRIGLVNYLENQLRDLKADAKEDVEFPPIGVWSDPTAPAPRREDGES